jgi:hypothetical protein
MFRFIATIIALSFSSVVFAAGPATIELHGSNGKVSFQHQKHQDTLKDCTKCHVTQSGGKIEGFGKEIAHKTCKACHAEMGKGPISCKDCHKK